MDQYFFFARFRRQCAIKGAFMTKVASMCGGSLGNRQSSVKDDPILHVFMVWFLCSAFRGVRCDDATSIQDAGEKRTVWVNHQHIIINTEEVNSVK
jgi:hypothetical protein